MGNAYENHRNLWPVICVIIIIVIIRGGAGGGGGGGKLSSNDKEFILNFFDFYKPVLKFGIQSVSNFQSVSEKPGTITQMTSSGWETYWFPRIFHAETFIPLSVISALFSKLLARSFHQNCRPEYLNCKFHAFWLSNSLHSPNLPKEKCTSKVVRIGSTIIFRLSKLGKAKFFILCDTFFLVRLQEKIAHCWEWRVVAVVLEKDMIEIGGVRMHNVDNRLDPRMTLKGGWPVARWIRALLAACISLLTTTGTILIIRSDKWSHGTQLKSSDSETKGNGFDLNSWYFELALRFETSQGPLCFEIPCLLRIA